MYVNEEELKLAYKEKAIEEFYDPVKKESVLRYGDDRMLFDSVSSIMKVVSVIETMPKVIFESVSFKSGQLFLNKAEEVVIEEIFSINYSELKNRMLLFKVNPHVRVFFECYKDIEPFNPLVVDRSKLPECFLRLNRFVAAVRERISSNAFKREISAHIRAANKNYSGLLDYIDALFSRYSRLLVLRIDLSYGKGNLKIEESSNSRDRLDVFNRVSEQISTHRTALINYLKNKCPDLGMVGYVWKLEYGRDKGHHYHMMFFLDGAKVRQDIVIAKRIGEHWNNVITEGKGVYFNCNGKKSSYKYCGVGMINYSDEDKLDNLKRAAVYITKVDRYISACMPGDKRTFGKGNSPRTSNRAVGRPRMR